MNPQLNELVLEVEREFILRGWSFTALDVGNMLKSRGVNVRQRDVSPVVRGHFTSCSDYSESDYVRTLIPVRESTALAFLYHPVDSDPDSYRGTEQRAVLYDPRKPVFPGQSSPTRVATVIFGYTGN